MNAKRQVADRLFLTSLSLLFVGVAFFESASLAHAMLLSGGWIARACMCMLLAASVVAFADTVINDILPARFTLAKAQVMRRGLWMFIAITHAGIAFVFIRNGSTGWPAAVYLLCTARAAAVAFLDLWYQYRDLIRDPATPLNGTIPGALGDD